MMERTPETRRLLLLLVMLQRVISQHGRR